MLDFFCPRDGHFVFQDSVFVRYEDCAYEVVTKLARKLLEDSRLTSNLRFLHNTFVLYGLTGADHYTRAGEKKWSELLPIHLLEEVQKTNNVILGFVVVDTKNTPGVCRVEMVKSFFESHGVFQRMMTKLEQLYPDRTIIPHDIIDEERAVNVWVQYLECGIEDDPMYEKHMTSSDYNKICSIVHERNESAQFDV